MYLEIAKQKLVVRKIKKIRATFIGFLKIN